MYTIKSGKKHMISGTSSFYGLLHQANLPLPDLWVEVTHLLDTFRTGNSQTIWHTVPAYHRSSKPACLPWLLQQYCYYKNSTWVVPRVCKLLMLPKPQKTSDPVKEHTLHACHAVLHCVMNLWVSYDTLALWINRVMQLFQVINAQVKCVKFWKEVENPRAK